MTDRRARLSGQEHLFGAIIVLALSAQHVNAQDTNALLYGVTPSNRLITFSAAAPDTLLSNVPIVNLSAGERIVGVDVRPANNWLYGLGSAGQLYIINQVTGAAIRIGVPVSPPLAGNAFGFDFNPAVDRIRVVSDTGQNLRLHPDTGAVAAVDGALAYTAGDPNAGRTPGVQAAAYTNPDNDPATGTTLFDIDTALDIVTTQNPPNDGRLNTTVSLGSDAISVGFDIGPSSFYASVQAAGAATSRLIIMTGAQRVDAGVIGGGEPVSSLAVSLGAPFSPPAERVFAVTDSNELIGFDPNNARAILSRVPIAPLNPGERLLGIDFRPANNLLYGLGSSSQLYIVDPRTGAASRVGAPLTPALSGAEFGFDFNPTVDRIRVVSDSGQNLRLHPDTGAVAGIDGALNFATGDSNAGRQPRVVGAAYTSPDNNPATGTTLFVIDSALDTGATQDPPNAGTLNTFMSLGADAGDLLGFDISLSQVLVVMSPGPSVPSVLFDVANRARRNLGAIGNNELIRGLAISLGR